MIDPHDRSAVSIRDRYRVIDTSRCYHFVQRLETSGLFVCNTGACSGVNRTSYLFAKLEMNSLATLAVKLARVSPPGPARPSE
ncbi:uncharacterized protein YALI1_C12433g [Yarrowia lipolytica]|uniref:Uncharacterized protein n=1 Tax=Yarrowia lipolytica TaxID=4952 RepID=A0A1D8NA93_YARLL|nr:hypothetical protein YALI1_C12433g [Yarrowia lipolytica]